MYSMSVNDAEIDSCTRSSTILESLEVHFEFRMKMNVLGDLAYRRLDLESIDHEFWTAVCTQTGPVLGEGGDKLQLQPS